MSRSACYKRYSNPFYAQERKLQKKAFKAYVEASGHKIEEFYCKRGDETLKMIEKDKTEAALDVLFG